MADWFRSWHGAPTDPKWRTIAKRAKVAPSLVVAVAWALMDRASQNSERGSIGGLDVETLADFMDCEIDDIERIIGAMREKCVLTDEAFTAWEKRQPIREDGSAERARLWREQRRQEKEEAERLRTEQSEQERAQTQPNAKEHRCRADAEAEKNAAAAARDVPDPRTSLELECRALVGDEPCSVDPDFGPMLALLHEGLTEDDIRTGILEGLQKSRPNYRFKFWGNFEKWVRTAAKNRLEQKPRPRLAAVTSRKPDPPDDPRIQFGGGWSSLLSGAAKAHRNGTWNRDEWGPMVGEPGCRVPEEHRAKLLAMATLTDGEAA